MNLVIISASQRKQSQSAKVAQYLSKVSTGYKKVMHFELCQYQLPLWDGEQTSKFLKSCDWGMINQHLNEADAVIVITPEWHGITFIKKFLNDVFKSRHGSQACIISRGF